MKPVTTYKNGFKIPCKMFIYIIFTLFIVFLNCLRTIAQDRIQISIDSVYYVCSNKGWDSLLSENVERIMVILEKEFILPNIEGENVLVYLMKSANVEEIKTGIKLKPYLLIYKSDTNFPDFLKEAKEEELEIEEWMYDLLHWDIKNTVIERTAS